jgi:hypothetical protein
MPKSWMLSTLDQQPTTEPSMLEALLQRYDFFFLFPILLILGVRNTQAFAKELIHTYGVTCIFGGAWRLGTGLL